MKGGAATDALLPRILIESRTYTYREFEDYVFVTINNRKNTIK
jgi:hypothetical protein